MDKTDISSPVFAWWLNCIAALCDAVSSPSLISTHLSHSLMYSRKSFLSQRSRGSHTFLYGFRSGFRLFLPSKWFDAGGACRSMLWGQSLLGWAWHKVYTSFAHTALQTTSRHASRKCLCHLSIAVWSFCANACYWNSFLQFSEDVVHQIWKRRPLCHDRGLKSSRLFLHTQEAYVYWKIFYLSKYNHRNKNSTLRPTATSNMDTAFQMIGYRKSAVMLLITNPASWSFNDSSHHDKKKRCINWC